MDLITIVFAVISTVMEDTSEEGFPQMKERAKVSQTVYLTRVNKNHDHQGAGNFQGRLRIIPKSITLIVFFIGLFCWSGCACFDEKPSTLETTLESQALQMAALGDRLGRCEHQWQTNADELMRYNQVTMRDLEVFREEQAQLRESVHGMDERWSVQAQYLRSRQRQMQQELTDLNQGVRAVDERLTTVDQGMQEKIESRHRALTRDIEAVDTKAQTGNEQIAKLRAQANTLAEDLSALQKEQQAMGTLLAADNEEIVDHLSTMTQNQGKLSDSLVQTQSTAHHAVEKLALVDGKQDQLVEWTQVHSKRVETLDEEAQARHVALTTEVKQIKKRAGSMQNKLAANQKSLAKTTTERFDRLETQHQAAEDQSNQQHKALVQHMNTLEQQGVAVRGQLTEVIANQSAQTEEAAAGFGGVTQSQSQIKNLIQEQGEEFDSLEATLQADHQQLAGQISEVQSATQAVSKQVGKIQQTSRNQAKSHSEALAGLADSLGNTHKELQEENLTTRQVIQDANEDTKQQHAAVDKQLAGLRQGQKNLQDWTKCQDKEDTKQQQAAQERHDDLTQDLAEIKQQGRELKTQLAQTRQASTEQGLKAQSQRDELLQGQAHMKEKLKQQATQEQLAQTTQAGTEQNLKAQAQRDQLIQGQAHIKEKLKQQATQEQLGRAAQASTEQNLKAQAQRDQIVKNQARIENQLKQQTTAQQKADHKTNDKMMGLSKQINAVQGSVNDQKDAQTRSHADLKAQTQTGFSQLNKQQVELQGSVQQQERELQTLQQKTEAQDKLLRNQAARLDSLNKTLATQVQHVVQSQDKLKKDLQGDNKATADTLHKRSTELQQQLKQMTQMLVQLESRLQKTSADLNKNVQNSSAAERKGTQALQNELQQLQKTVGQVRNVQKSLQQQLERLQKTVQAQHRQQSAELTQIKKKVTEPKTAPKKKPKNSQPKTEEK